MHGHQSDRRRARMLRAVAPLWCLGLGGLVGCSSETSLPLGTGAAQESTSTVPAEATSTIDASTSTVAPATSVEAVSTSAGVTTTPADATATSAAETTETVTDTAPPPPSSAPPDVVSDVRLPAGTVVSMSWPAAHDGWALVDGGGDQRTLVHTTDGATWAPASAFTARGLQVVFADATNGWVVSADGLTSTHDGGATWNAVSLPASDTVAAVAAASGTVHVAYLGVDTGGGVALTVASSPIDRDDFGPTALRIPVGAGPRLDVSMTAGGPYAALIYNDRTVVGAAQITNSGWANWKLTCPYENPTAQVGLSAQGKNLAVACGPSGFGDNESIVGLNLNGGGSGWVDILPAGAGDTAMATLAFVTATDAGVRVVGYTKPDGNGELAASSDGGATWTQRTPLPAASTLSAVTSLPDGGVIVALRPSGGLVSADGLSWSPVAAAS